jgi:hypothetical protein
MRFPLFPRGSASAADPNPGRTTFYRHSQRERFFSPLPAPSRVAVVAPNFQEKDGLRSFNEGESKEIQSFRPEILAASVPVLLRLAQLLRVPRAVVAFSGARVGPVTHRDRDLLWSAYEVPVFEQSLAPDGSVFARECEAHDGLHLYLPQHYHGNLRHDACPCGRSEPRLL